MICWSIKIPPNSPTSLLYVAEPLLALNALLFSVDTLFSKLTKSLSAFVRNNHCFQKYEQFYFL